MLCRNCGSQIPDNSKFCVNCGIKIENEQAGVTPKRVISDRHYSLEEIAEQQKEQNPIGINQPKGVNLSKAPSSENLQNLIHSEQSPFSTMPKAPIDSQKIGMASTEPPLPLNNEIHKMKSAGFPDETEPVKRPPISEPITPNNPPSVESNNNYNYNYNYTDNTNTGFSAQNNAVNNEFSFSGTNNGTSPEYNYNKNNNTYNSYSPTAVPHSSDKNSKAAIILITIAVIIGVIMIFAVVFMLASGNNNNDSTSQNSTGQPDYENSVSAETSNTNIPSVSGEYSSLVYSNHQNHSLAAEDDSGNVYYTDDNGCINKLDKNGNDTVVYTSNSFPTYLNWYDGRLYFIMPYNGYEAICSISTGNSSSNFSVHTNNEDISLLFVSDGYMYYSKNEYIEYNKSSAVFRKNISSAKVEQIYFIDNATIPAVYPYGDSIYIPFYSHDDYICQMIKIDKNDFNKQAYINSADSEYDYFYITVQNNKFYFINSGIDAEYSIWSMDMDGGSGKQLSNVTDCDGMAIYGDYIYYTKANLLDNSEVNYALYRMKTDGTENTLISDKNVDFISFAGNKIYYYNSDTDHIERMNLDGSETKILN